MVAVLGNIVSPILIISRAIGASGPIFDVIDSDKPSWSGLRDPEVSSQADILFHDVTFAYPTRRRVNVLKGFNARFQKGITTALVGPSGSGKSTIVALIERWYQLPTVSESDKEVDQPQGHVHEYQGQILVGNGNINCLDLKWWRSQIGLVQQEPVLFNESVFENVASGLIGSKWEKEPDAVKMELVTKACTEAYADGFVRRLPEVLPCIPSFCCILLLGVTPKQGYLTVVGEGGVNLSGGQRQRLAIARSIVGQPPILILDEATSSIDVNAETIVQAALDRVTKDRTTIMIAHRLSTVQRADHIIVMHDGGNAEEGSHAELAMKGGIYQSLVHAQQLESLPYAELENQEKHNRESQKEESEQLEKIPSLDENGADQPDLKQASKLSHFRRSLPLLYEQRARWRLYLLTLVGAVGAGCMVISLIREMFFLHKANLIIAGFALQSWLFAQLIQAFQFTGQKLADAANFWALMLFILALAMAAFYFILGFTSNRISVVSSRYLIIFTLRLMRHRMLEAYIAKTISSV